MRLRLHARFEAAERPWFLDQEAKTKLVEKVSENEEAEVVLTNTFENANRIYKQSLQKVICNLGLSLPMRTPDMLLTSAPDLGIEPDVFDALKKWTTNMTSSFLWIEGPADIEIPSLNTMTSVSLVGVAQRSSASYLAWFGQSSRARNHTDRAKRCAEGLVSIVYTLISQLTNQLPEVFKCDVDLSNVRFTCLNGTEDSIPPATLLLEDLLNIFPNPLLCVIDGLQYLTYGAKKDTIACICNLVEVLCTQNNFQIGARKVCFTTDGYIEALSNATNTVNLSRVTYETESMDDDRDIQDL